jgi:hypothetical protein
MIPHEPMSSGKRPGSRDWWLSWRLLPVVYVVLGAIILGAELATGHGTRGLLWLGVMVAIAAIYGFGGRFDLIRQARGDLIDEREGSIHTRALAATGIVLVWVLTGVIVYELANGNNPGPYSLLMLIGGATYIVTLLIARYRS